MGKESTVVNYILGYGVQIGNLCQEGNFVNDLVVTGNFLKTGDKFIFTIWKTS